MRKTQNRRGASFVQMAIVLAVVTIVVIASVQLLGTATSGEMSSAAVEVGNPAYLADHFSGSGHAGSSGGSGGSSGSGSSGSGSSGSSGGGSDNSGSDSGGGDDGGGGSNDDGGGDGGGDVCP